MNDYASRLRLITRRQTVPSDEFERTLYGAANEIERLREALRMIADGDVPRQHVVRWRQDGQLSKHDKCPHDKWMYDDCDECVASFARAALEQAQPVAAREKE